MSPDIVQHISLAMGSAWASGVNLYATIFVLGLMNRLGELTLPPEMQVLSSPMVMVAAGVMYVVEFITDKIPVVDTTWDTIHTFIRIPAGAILASMAIGDLGPGAELAGYVLGGGLAATTHATKAGTRVLINTSPEPVTNWAASLTEDVAVLGGLYTALNYPWAFIAALVVFMILFIWLLPKLWRGIKKVFGAIGRLLGFKKEEPPPAPDGQPQPTGAPMASGPAQAIEPSTPPQPGPEAQPVPTAPAQPAPAQSPPIGTSRTAELSAELEALEQMKADGKLSEEEHAELKKKVLDRFQ